MYLLTIYFFWFFFCRKPLWSELIRSLSEKEFDLSGTNSAVTLERSKIVEFSVPITTTTYM